MNERAKKESYFFMTHAHSLISLNYFLPTLLSHIENDLNITIQLATIYIKLSSTCSCSTLMSRMEELFLWSVIVIKI